MAHTAGVSLAAMMRAMVRREGSGSEVYQNNPARFLGTTRHSFQNLQLLAEIYRL